MLRRSSAASWSWSWRAASAATPSPSGCARAASAVRATHWRAAASGSRAAPPAGRPVPRSAPPTALKLRASAATSSRPSTATRAARSPAPCWSTPRCSLSSRCVIRRETGQATSAPASISSPSASNRTHRPRPGSDAMRPGQQHAGRRACRSRRSTAGAARATATASASPSRRRRAAVVDQPAAGPGDDGAVLVQHGQVDPRAPMPALQRPAQLAPGLRRPAGRISTASSRGEPLLERRRRAPAAFHHQASDTANANTARLPSTARKMVSDRRRRHAIAYARPAGAPARSRCPAPSAGAAAAWIVLDRLADLADVDVDRAVERFERLAPHQVHQPVTRQHPAGIARQREQQVELVRGQRPLARRRCAPSRAPASISIRPKRSTPACAGAAGSAASSGSLDAGLVDRVGRLHRRPTQRPARRLLAACAPGAQQPNAAAAP